MRSDRRIRASRGMLTGLFAIAALAIGSAFSAPATFAVPASALARTATASIPDARDDNGASFTQTPTDLTHLEIVWDGNALTIKLTYAQAPPSHRLDLLMSDSNPQTGAEETCDPDAADSITVTATRDGHATIEMPYIEGSLQVDGSIADNTITYSFSHPALTDAINRGRDPFTCVSGTADGDDFYGPFEGKTLKLTSAGATAALRGALTRRFGSAFTKAPQKWAACPKQQIIPESENFSAYAICHFEFGRRGGLYHGGSDQVMILGGLWDATSYLKSRTYRKNLRTCHIASTKRGWVNGAYLTNRTLRNSQSLGNAKNCKFLVGSAGMAADLEYSLVTGKRPRRAIAIEHGTNGGFEAEASYPCRVRRRGNRFRFDCRNQLGDRFIYSFTVHPGRG